MRTSSRPARARRRYHSAVMVGRWAPGCLPTMTQGFVGMRRMPASTASAVGVSGTMRVPVLPSRSRNSPAVRSTSSQRSVRISFNRQPVSMRRRSAAMA